MTTFKTFLAEGAAASLDFNSWTMGTLLAAYENAGYDLSSEDRRSFKALKFDKKSGKKPCFWVLCFNEEADTDEDAPDQFYITKLFLEFRDGKIAAEPQGMPSFEGTWAEMNDKLKKL